MRLNETTQNKVNDTISKITEMDMNVCNIMGHTGICKGSWHICDLEDLTALICELQNIQAAIERETGLEL